MDQTQIELAVKPNATPAVQPEQIPLTEALRQIRVDAADRPADYLQETAVPLGGE